MSNAQRSSPTKSRASSRREADARDHQPDGTQSDRYADGIAVRRAVLGDAHVDRALAGRTEFNREFEDLIITRYAWGEIWTRPRLPRRTRSLVTLGMLVALNRIEELRMHVRGALNNGVSRDEIKEVLLQAAIYCGVPAAHAAFRSAEAAFEELDRKKAGASR